MTLQQFYSVAYLNFCDDRLWNSNTISSKISVFG